MRIHTFRWRKDNGTRVTFGDLCRWLYIISRIDVASYAGEIMRAVTSIVRLNDERRRFGGYKKLSMVNGRRTRVACVTIREDNREIREITRN